MKQIDDFKLDEELGQPSRRPKIIRSRPAGAEVDCRLPADRERRAATEQVHRPDHGAAAAMAARPNPMLHRSKRPRDPPPPFGSRGAHALFLQSFNFFFVPMLRPVEDMTEARFVRMWKMTAVVAIALSDKAAAPSQLSCWSATSPGAGAVWLGWFLAGKDCAPTCRQWMILWFN
jgi:hypothetical protein